MSGDWLYLLVPDIFCLKCRIADESRMDAIRKFIVGENNFRAQTPWGGWAAFFMSVGFFVFQVLAAIVVGGAVVLWLHGVEIFAGNPSPEEIKSFIDIGIFTALASYILTFGLILLVGGSRNGSIGDVLLLKMPVKPIANIVFGIAIVAVFFIGFSYIIENFFPRDGVESEAQMKQIFGLIGESNLLWAGVAVIVLGAPFVEEAIFRGFLLTSFSKTRLGFWGAAVLSSALWAAIHGYAVSMAVGLFVFGLLLSLLVRRTGSIWISILLHALWNAGVTAAIFVAMKAG